MGKARAIVTAKVVRAVVAGAVLAIAACFTHSAQAAAVDVAGQSISLAMLTEPPTLHSARATDTISGFVLSHIMEGLLRYGENGELLPGVAERWHIDDKGARFWLRSDALWSDGRPVTARDFVFAWQYALRPETASQYAFILYPIKGAREINEGEKAASTLGVKALSDTELYVEFAEPCPYFLSLTAFKTYMPLREDAIERWGRRYAADVQTMLFNGPFVLETWVHGAELVMAKNPRYWDRQSIRLSRINIPYITSDPGAQFNLFRDGRIALASLDTGLLGEAMKRGYEIRHFHSGALYFLEFNFREGRITANRNFRKAIQYLLDPEVLVNKVIGLPGVLPAYSLFPVNVRGRHQPFREEYPVMKVSQNLAKARRHLENARRELGLSEFPPLVLLAGDSPIASQEAEYYQYLLKRGLGLELRIDQQVFKQRIEKMRRGDFDIVVAAWGPDYDDIMTFADLFASWNDNNRGRYHNPEYDRLVRRAQYTTDPQRRYAAMAALQDLVVDDVPILPTYESAMLYVQHPKLKGVQRLVFGGDPNFRNAWIEP